MTKGKGLPDRRRLCPCLEWLGLIFIFSRTKTIVLIQDDLNTLRAFPAADARRLVERFEPDRPQAMRFDWSELSLELIQARRF
jgi:hypothetical protein